MLDTFLREAGYAAGGGGDIRLFVAGIIQIALSVVGIIFFLLMLYGGFLWLTAGGNNEQVSRARTLMLSAVFGFIIVLLALTITRFVVGVIESAGGEPSGTDVQRERLF